MRFTNPYTKRTYFVIICMYSQALTGKEKLQMDVEELSHVGSGYHACVTGDNEVVLTITLDHLGISDEQVRIVLFEYCIAIKVERIIKPANIFLSIAVNQTMTVQYCPVTLQTSRLSKNVKLATFSKRGNSIQRTSCLLITNRISNFGFGSFVTSCSRRSKLYSYFPWQTRQLDSKNYLSYVRDFIFWI